MNDILRPQPGLGIEDPQSELIRFLASHDGVLCFGGEDWWYHNQAHFDMQIMRSISRRVPVLYVNSVGFRMPSVQEGAKFFHRIGRKLRSVAHPIHRPFPGLHVASPFSVPLWQRPTIARLNVLSLRIQIGRAVRRVGFRNPLLWVACPTAYDVARQMQGNAFLVYQRTDKYEEYSDQTRGYLLAADRWLSARADLVLYASTALYEEECERNPRSLLVKHGVDLARFNPEKALMAGKPIDLAAIEGPIVGFFGDIDADTMDMDLIGETIRALPEASFVFVGRVIDYPESVRGLSNVHFVGKKPYEEVPRYGAHFDVAIMPWKRNRWIHYCNPIKLKEYLALGLPIVSTEFPEALLYRGVIYVAKTGEDFIQGIRDALQGRGVGTVDSRRARVTGDTWEQAMLQIAKTIRKLASQNLQDS